MGVFHDYIVFDQSQRVPWMSMVDQVSAVNPHEHGAVGYDEAGLRNPTSFTIASRHPCPASYPNYASYEDRLTSFHVNEWPSRLPQKPEVLAAAGFFYRGYKDHVFCYMCDGGVKDWEDDDDPWVEHQRWYKNCPHLQLSQTRPTEAQSVLDRPKETLAQWNPSVPPPQEREALRGPEEQRGQSGGGSRDDCVVCFDGEKMVLFSPCSHLVCCPGCADKLTCCPICRQLIRDKIHVFKC